MTNPVFSEFNPRAVAWQFEAKKFIRAWDYRVNGILEVLFSGSVGSAKSILAANLGVSHCLMYSGAELGIFRRALPDLKDTIYQTIVEHIDGSEIVIDGIKDTMREGVHYSLNSTRASIDFCNGSYIGAGYWADKKYRRLRSKPYSCGIIEELTENSNEECEGFYPEVLSRIGRVNEINAGVKENWLLTLTNPEGESHWGYNYFILNPEKVFNRKVFYSLTEQNPFLPKTYIESLRRSLTPIQARRKLRGEWIDDASDKIYSCYDRTVHYKDEVYKINHAIPIHLSWDFNIGEGKPLSMCCFQEDVKRDHFDFFEEVVVQGARTNDSLEELAASGILDLDCPYFVVNGDPAGAHSDTRSVRSDYDIIKKFLSNYIRKDGKGIKFFVELPSSHPPVKLRHNTMNAYFKNDLGEARITVWKCPTLDKGFRLTVLKKGGSYVEDDSKAHPYQHVTTAAGYGVCESIRRREINKPIDPRLLGA